MKGGKEMKLAGVLFEENQLYWSKTESSEPG